MKSTYVLQWRHHAGSVHFDGEWHNEQGGEADNYSEQADRLQWLREECPRLFFGFAHRIVFRTVAGDELFVPYPLQALIDQREDFLLQRLFTQYGSDQYDSLTELADDIEQTILAISEVRAAWH